MSEDFHTGDSGAMEAGADVPPAFTARWDPTVALGLTALTAAVTVGGGLLAAYVAKLTVLRDLSADARAAMTASVLIVAYLVIVLAVRQASRSTGLAFADAVGLHRVPTGRTLLTACALALTGRLLTGVWMLLVVAVGFEVPSDLDPTRLFPLTPLGIGLMVLLACVAAPVAEELVFRGVLLPALQFRWSVGVAVVVSAAAFAVLHVVGIVMPPIFVFALLLGRAFLRSRSLWTPIAAHAVFNGLGLVSLYLLRGTGAL